MEWQDLLMIILFSVNAYTDDREIRLLRSDRLYTMPALNGLNLHFHCPKSSPSISAEGLYLNYLQMEQAVIVPISMASTTTLRSEY